MENLGVEVRKTDCDACGVSVGEEGIAAAAGVVASSAGKWLGAKVDRAGRIFLTESRPPDFVLLANTTHGVPDRTRFDAR
jgi:hypothetical protein